MFLSIAAVALSTALLIVVASLFSGFIEAIEKTGREAFGDIYLNPRAQIPEYERLLERLEAVPEIETATAVLETYGLLHLGGGDVRSVRVLGIEPQKYSQVAEFKKALLKQKDTSAPPGFEVEGFAGESGIIVGIGVLGEPDEKTDEYDFEQIRKRFGEEVVLTSGAVVEKAKADGSGETEQQFKPRYSKHKVADIFFSGVYVFDSEQVYLPIGQVRELIGDVTSGQYGPHEVVEIKIRGDAKPQEVKVQVGKIWSDFAHEHNLPEYCATRPLLKTSEEMQEYFVAELQKQMGVLMLIFGIVCSAVIVLVFCIFYMIVMTRQKDIAVIKSCGSGGWSVVWIFVGFGVCVGIIGCSFGVSLGYIITKRINTLEEWFRIMFGLKLWKSSVYVFEKIPNQVDLSAIWWIVLFAVVAAAIGALIPAIVAAKAKPVEILRYE